MVPIRQEEGDEQKEADRCDHEHERSALQVTNVGVGDAAQQSTREPHKDSDRQRARQPGRQPGVVVHGPEAATVTCVVSETP